MTPPAARNNRASKVGSRYDGHAISPSLRGRIERYLRGES